MTYKKSHVLVSGANLQNKSLLVEGTNITAKIGRFSRRFNLGVFLSNLNLEYMSLNPKRITLLKIAFDRLISLSRQNGIRHTLRHIFAYKVTLIVDPGKLARPLAFRIMNDKRSTWVSRVAITSGVIPYSLNHSQEYDFARFPEKFACFIWDLRVNENSLILHENLKVKTFGVREVRIDNTHPDNRLTFKKLRNASIFHSRTVVSEGSVIPSDFHNFIDGSWPSDFVFKRKEQYHLFADHIFREEHKGEFVFFGSSTSWFHFLIEVFPRYLHYGRNTLESLRPVLEHGVPNQILEVMNLVTHQDPVLLGAFQESVFENLVVCTESRFSKGLDLQGRASDIAMVRSFFDNEFSLSKIERNQKIFIVRNKSLFRHSEVVSNFSEFCALQGFLVVDTGELTMEQQMRLFASAELIIGETGSSLTNLIFCSPGAKVIEINLHNFMPQFFSDFCDALNLSHTEFRDIVVNENGISVEINNRRVDFLSLLESPSENL
jgi:hypothetical protein